MSKGTTNKPSAPHKGGSPLLTGIVVGMIIGVSMAAGLAWWIMKSPSPFVQKEQVGMTRSSLPPAKPEAASAPTAPPAATAAEGDKPRFEFYKVLTDKQDAGVATSSSADKPKAPAPKPPVGPQYLQVGSFTSAADAENLKARLAFQGFEAGIQTVTIPDKGVWHRVRLGPYKSAEEMSKARTTLKQNGVDSTPIPAQ